MRGLAPLFRYLSGGVARMSDLAAGKKAAAIKAIDDYVKVHKENPAHFLLFFV